MSPTQQENRVEECRAPERSSWTKPEFARLETGEAEGQDGTGTDALGALS